MVAAHRALQSGPVVIAKRGKRDPGHRDRRQRLFLADMAGESSAVMRRAMQIVRGQRRTLPLTFGERHAFVGLIDTVNDGWDHAKESRARAGPVLLAKRALQIDVAAADPPTAFLATYEKRELKLAGVYEQARLQRVKKTIAKGVSIGASLPEIEAQLAQDLPTFSNARLHNIARTETSILFSHGKYAQSAMDPFVTGWEFFAVMDERTTDQCAARHTRQWLKPNEPDTPPLHYLCRSELLEIFGGERADQVGIPDDAPPPFPGFGKAPSLVGIEMVPVAPQLLRTAVPTVAPVLPPATVSIIPGATTRAAFVSHAKRVILTATTALELTSRVTELQRLARTTEEWEVITDAAERKRRIT